MQETRVYSGVYMAIPISQLIPPSFLFPALVTVSFKRPFRLLENGLKWYKSEGTQIMQRLKQMFCWERNSWSPFPGNDTSI